MINGAAVLQWWRCCAVGINLWLPTALLPDKCLVWLLDRSRAGMRTAEIMAIRQGRHGRMADSGATARLLPDRLAEFPSLPICGSARANRTGMAVLAIRQWPDHQALDAGTRRRFPSARPARPARFKHAWPRGSVA